MSAHTMLAALTSVPELELDKSEAEKLGAGIVNVSRHYDIGATQKTIDWTNLIMVVGAVYGTRLAAVRMRKAAQKLGTAAE